MRGLGIMVLLLASSAAHASGEVAAQAADVWQEHCADTQAAKGSQVGDSFVAVGSAFADVSKAIEAGPVPSLYYWRGLLGSCLGREDLVDEDLRTFLKKVEDDPVYAAQADDARRRLRIVLRSATGPNVPHPAGIVAGIGTASGSVVTLVGSLDAHQTYRGSYSYLLSGAQSTDDFPSEEAIGQEAVTRANVLGISSVALTATSIAAFIVSAVTAKPNITAAVVPTDQGLALTVGGRW